MSSVRDRFCKILNKNLGVPEANIMDSDTLDSLGADSLDRVDLIMDCEEEFGFEIADSEVEGLATVGDFLTYIECHL